MSEVEKTNAKTINRELIQLAKDTAISGRRSFERAVETSLHIELFMAEQRQKRKIDEGHCHRTYA